MKYAIFKSPIGPIRVISDETHLLQLEITDAPCAYEKEMTDPIRSIQQEFSDYFAGSLQTFKTPLRPTGTPFQLLVWETLRKIPYGKTCSYADLAKEIGNPNACRAVGTANGKNPLSIIVPCHRVINNDGKLGGYNGGLHRKQWLLDHEIRFLPRLSLPSSVNLCRD